MDGVTTAPGSSQDGATKAIEQVTGCFMKTLQDNGVEREAGELLTYLGSDEWIKVVESGTKQEFIDEFGDAIDPLTEKLLGAYGPDIVMQMPTEMHTWIKDSTILWIKN